MTIGDWMPITAGILGLTGGVSKIWNQVLIDRKVGSLGTNGTLRTTATGHFDELRTQPRIQVRVEVDGRIITVDGPVSPQELSVLEQTFGGQADSATETIARL